MRWLTHHFPSLAFRATSPQGRGAISPLPWGEGEGARGSASHYAVYILIISILTIPIARAADTDLSGSLRLGYFTSSRHLDETNNVLGASVDFELRHYFDSGQRFDLDMRLLREDFRREGNDEMRLQGAYWSARFDSIDLRIGQQKIRWGKADGINPTDFFTPIDFTTLLPLEADRYQSIPAARVDVQLDDASSLSLVVSPGFTPTKLPWPRHAPVAVNDDEPSGWRRPQFGMRYLQTGPSMDWSVCAFRGFSTLPVLTLTGVESQGVPRYQRYYPRSAGFGVDIARTLGQWGVRAELAYTKIEAPDARQPVASSIFLVAGVDRFIDTWNINVQGLLRHTPSYQTTLAAGDPLEAVAATQNAIIYGQQERVTPGMTLRVGKSGWHETLQAELLAIAYFRPASYAVRPLVTYAVSDQVKVRGGVEYYHGPADSYFGLLERNRMMFVEVERYFE